MHFRKQITLGALALLAAGCGAAGAFAEDKDKVAPPAAPVFGASAQPAPKLEKGFTSLYNGRNTDGWKMAGPGSFAQIPDGSLLPQGGMGLFWYSKEKFKDFVLKVDFKAASANANSGIFIRFPDPANDPWKPVNEGYEIQISDGGGEKHRTGAVFTFSASSFTPSRPYGQWNTMEIKAVGKKYTVWVNGRKVTEYEGDRSLEGYIGLQNHDPSGQVAYRNIRIKKL